MFCCSTYYVGIVYMHGEKYLTPEQTLMSNFIAIDNVVQCMYFMCIHVTYSNQATYASFRSSWATSATPAARSSIGRQPYAVRRRRGDGRVLRGLGQDWRPGAGTVHRALQYDLLSLSGPNGHRMGGGPVRAGTPHAAVSHKEEQIQVLCH